MDDVDGFCVGEFDGVGVVFVDVIEGRFVLYDYVGWCYIGDFDGVVF